MMKEILGGFPQVQPHIYYMVPYAKKGDWGMTSSLCFKKTLEIYLNVIMNYDTASTYYLLT